MKNKTTIIVLLISIIISFALGFLVNRLTTKEEMKITEEPKEECNCNNYCQTYLENLKSNEENFVELNSEQQKIYDAVSKYGNEIYKNKKYESLKKDHAGVYYASLNDLEIMGYDISMFKSNCDKASPIIYFDIEYKIDQNYANGPLQYSIECSEVVEK